MRLTLFLAIQSAKRYRKKHNMPDCMEMPEGYEKEQFERNANMDLDCTTLDSKLLQGLELEQVALKDCGGWHIRAEKNPKDKVLYYIHGGGFVAGCTRGSFRFISYAVRHFGYDMFSVDYRLAPNVKCRDTVSDCLEGYKHLLTRYAPENIVLMGESAGGNLVLVTTERAKEEGLPLPGGVVSCSPVVQFVRYPYSYYENSCKTDYGIIFGINEGVLSLYQGDLPADHYYLSPLCGDLSGFPPVYLDASSRESLRDEARMMYVRLKEEGGYVEYHELRDFFHAMLTTPQFGFVRREEYPHIIRFINKVFQGEIPEAKT